ncbi:hypothetical protein H4R34_001900 [Dimargaris verticillata]|uniref:Carbohydrate kinase FGGY C-terminal domain-containing protein n=1 Tax=Dimargaris verticillata TaxID=2761393 RepID=A0A9W8B904_9FUNG|nr:hypothetical protein H4R34_001900 [Dimargaris verticillata]
MPYYVGVDVGTGSVRAALFHVTEPFPVPNTRRTPFLSDPKSNGASTLPTTASTRLTALHVHPITTRQEQRPKLASPPTTPSESGDWVTHYEQSSTEIWQAVCFCVRQCLTQALVDNPSFDVGQVRGIGFDATCSLVVVQPAPNTGSAAEALASSGVVDPSTWQPVCVSESTLRQFHQASDFVAPQATSNQTTSDNGAPPQAPAPHEYNVILWMDHRAEAQAARISASPVATKRVLHHLGGQVSPEMDLPKVVWLKECCQLTESTTATDVRSLWDNMQLFSLPDYLSFRATGRRVRSACSLVCKWGSLPPLAAVPQAPYPDATHADHPCPDTGGWDHELFRAIGLEDFVADGYRRIGGLQCLPADQQPPPITSVAHRDTGFTGVCQAGGQVGYLCPAATVELGLGPRTCVSSSVIDAYAGWIGTIATRDPTVQPSNSSLDALLASARAADLTPIVTSRLGIIAGTSSCHLATHIDPQFIPGLWGPYYSVGIAGLWMTEGGQSATGALIDWAVKTHPGFPAATAQLQTETSAADPSEPSLGNIYSFLNSIIRRDLLHRTDSHYDGYLHLLGRDTLHVLPDFHGNRSPLADPTLKGAIVGLTLEPMNTVFALAKYYLAVLVALAYGTKHILDTLQQRRYPIDTLVLSGGLSKNDLFVQIHADVTQCAVLVSNIPEGAEVLLGSAMCARAATMQSPTASNADRAQALWETMVYMGPTGVWVLPQCTPAEQRLHAQRFQVLRAMQQDQKKYQRIMGAEL